MRPSRPRALSAAKAVTTASLGLANAPAVAFYGTARRWSASCENRHRYSSWRRPPSLLDVRFVPTRSDCSLALDDNGDSYSTTTSSSSLSSLSSSSSDGKFIGYATRLYVANVSFDTDEEVLADFFDKFGKVMECVLPGDRRDNRGGPDCASRRHRGFAFVTMSDGKGATSAVQAAKDGKAILDGRALLVSDAHPRGQRRPSRFDVGSGTSEPYRSSSSSSSSKASSTLRTLYSIDDEVCPPTDEGFLKNTVMKHCLTLERYLSSRPVAAHTSQAFDEVRERVKAFFPHGIPKGDSEAGIILDSGCGTAKSSLILGRMFPGDLVIGIDRSLARLTRNGVYREGMKTVDGADSDDTTDVEYDALTRSVPDLPNVILVRAELSNFWRLCVQEGWQLKMHYLLYPNPYPKRVRVKSRFYAHPSFPLILKLGGDIIVRSNWKLYLKEFASSVIYADKALGNTTDDENYARKYSLSAAAEPVEVIFQKDVLPMTNFEQKYFSCGERVYEICFNAGKTPS